MLADMSQPNQPRVTFARSGNLITDEENHNFVLTLTKGSTHVRMEQSGCRPHEEANYQGANYGRQRFIGGLDRLVARLG